MPLLTSTDIKPIVEQLKTIQQSLQQLNGRFADLSQSIRSQKQPNPAISSATPAGTIANPNTAELRAELPADRLPLRMEELIASLQLLIRQWERAPAPGQPTANPLPTLVQQVDSPNSTESTSQPNPTTQILTKDNTETSVEVALRTVLAEHHLNVQQLIETLQQHIAQRSVSMQVLQQTQQALMTTIDNIQQILQSVQQQTLPGSSKTASNTDQVMGSRESNDLSENTTPAQGIIPIEWTATITATISALQALRAELENFSLNNEGRKPEATPPTASAVFAQPTQPSLDPAKDSTPATGPTKDSTITAQDMASMAEQLSDTTQKSLALTKTQSELKTALESVQTSAQAVNELDFGPVTTKILSVSHAVSEQLFSVIEQLNQQQLKSIDSSIAQQQSRLSELERQLADGQQSAAAVSSEQLEAERNRLEQLESLRRQELERSQNFMVAQLVIQASIAVAKAFASLPFPANLIAAASTAAGLVAQLAAVRSQMQAVRADGGAEVLAGGQVRTYSPSAKGNGRLEGRSHVQGGILIEAEGGEHIFSRAQSRGFEALFAAIHRNTIQPQDVHWETTHATQQHNATTHASSTPNTLSHSIAKIGPYDEQRKGQESATLLAQQHSNLQAKQWHSFQSWAPQTSWLVIAPQYAVARTDKPADLPLAQLPQQFKTLHSQLMAIEEVIRHIGGTTVHLDAQGVYHITKRQGFYHDRLKKNS
jgi:hypothetical protein